MLAPGVRAVFFDAVGTLIHPDPPAPLVYAAVGRRHGSRLDDATIAHRFRAAFRREEELDRAHDLRTSEEREVRRWRRVVGDVLDDVTDPETCFLELFAHFARPEAWQADPDAAEVLPRLAARGYLVGVASNYDRRLRPVAAGLPAFRGVRHLVISSEVGWRKPAPAFFRAVAEAVRLPEAQIAFVGDDGENDYLGARRAGLQAVLLDPEGEAPAGTVRVARLTDLLPVGR